LKGTLWHRLDQAARAMSPFAITILLIMAGALPQRSPEVAPVIPALAMASVYYWSVFRPDLMPPWVIFLIGLFQDLLGGGPIGVQILGLLLIHVLVETQRRFFAHATFAMLWIVFAFFAAGVEFLIWILSSLLLETLVDPSAVLLQYFATVAAYPLLSWLFGRAQQAFLR
jgi:rod shape-determining protein MreD